MSSCISSKSSDDGPIEIQWLVVHGYFLFSGHVHGSIYCGIKISHMVTFPFKKKY